MGGIGELSRRDGNLGFRRRWRYHTRSAIRTRIATTGKTTDKAIMRVLLEEVEEVEVGVGVAPESTVLTVNEVLCFCDNDGDEALISTSTSLASVEVGVPEIVRELES